MHSYVLRKGTLDEIRMSGVEEVTFRFTPVALEVFINHQEKLFQMHLKA